METLLALLYFSNLGCLLMGHELDAIYQQEWRFFFAKTTINEQTAYRLFTALHIPLFVLILWNLSSSRFQIGVDLFAMIHAAVHWGLRHHPLIHFNNWFSRFWIFGSALLGATHLVLLLVTL